MTSSPLGHDHSKINYHKSITISFLGGGVVAINMFSDSKTIDKSMFSALLNQYFIGVFYRRPLEF